MLEQTSAVLWAFTFKRNKLCIIKMKLVEGTNFIHIISEVHTLILPKLISDILE